MKILVMIDDDNSLDFDVSSDLPLRDLKALIEAETDIPTDQMILKHKMLPLDDNGRGLDELGVCDDDIIILTTTAAAAGDLLTPRPAQSQPSSSIPQIEWGSVVIPSSVASSISGTNNTSSTAQAQPPPVLQPQASEPSGLPFDPETLIQHFLSNPEELAALQQRNPQMAESILSGNPDLITANIQTYRQQLMVTTNIMTVCL